MPSQTPALLMVLSMGLTACGGSSGPTGSPGGETVVPPPPPNPVQAAEIKVRNSVFVPEVVAVVPGGTVTWVWEGSDHSVVSVLTPGFAPGNSGVHSAPFTFGPVTFPAAGTYRFICSVHGSASGGSVVGMSGRVVVN